MRLVSVLASNTAVLLNEHEKGSGITYFQ